MQNIRSEKVKDLEFIKKFSKITVSGACKKAKVDRAGLLTNRLKDEKAKAVREEIENQIARLYIKEENNNVE